MINSKILNSSLIILTIFLTTSCQTIKSNQANRISAFMSEQEIPSLHQIYPLLEEEALEWDPDAGLDKAIIEINPKSETGFRIVSAFFHTQNRGQEYLFIEYFLDGAILVREGKYTFPIEEFILVEEIGTLIDSKVAWKIFSQYSEIGKLQIDDFSCAELILIKDATLNTFLWRLVVAGKCVQANPEYFYIDAKTGEWKE